MSQTLDLDEIKQKILEKLKPLGWDRVLRSFINSSDFDKIIKELIVQSRDGKRFTPPLKDMFSAFENCPYSNLKVVIVGQDPYPNFGVADGMAFSCSKTEKEQPSLRYILDAIDRTVYNNSGLTDRNPDLTRWANQGVLLLNTALTTTINRIGQHYLIWQPFLAYVFDWLTWNNNGLIYLYLGAEAKKWSGAVNDNNYKFYASHPASAAYNSLDKWDCGDVFKDISKLTQDNFNHVMIW